MQTKLLINGTLTAGQGMVERVLDPATGNCIAEVPEASASQLDAAVAAAEAAGTAWAQTVPKDRGLQHSTARDGQAVARHRVGSMSAPMSKSGAPLSNSGKP